MGILIWMIVGVVVLAVLHKPLTIVLGVVIIIVENLIKLVKVIIKVIVDVLKCVFLIVALPFIIINKAGNTKKVVKRSVK
jgi:hypothetical protein